MSESGVALQRAWRSLVAVLQRAWRSLVAVLQACATDRWREFDDLDGPMSRLRGRSA